VKSRPLLLPRRSGPDKTTLSTSSARIQILPLAKWKATTVLADPAAKPSSNLFQTDLEQRYFRVFCEKVTSRLAGFVNSPIWSQLILQASEQNESIRHAIIAVGALDITLQASKSATQVDPLAAMDEHHKFAITQYSKAITKMRISLSEKRHNLRTTLLTSLLIICFECLHGNHESAIAQMKSGLSLLEDWLETQRPPLIDTGAPSYSSSGISASVFGPRSPAPDSIEDE
jgi:hypothetical protein